MPLDKRVAGHAVCEHDAHIVGRGVAVNRYAVVGLLDILLQGIGQHFVRDSAVGRDEGQHGAHVRMNHAAALADAADAAGLAADGELDSRRLGLGVGGHDGTVGLFGGIVLQFKLRKVLLDALDVEALADNTRWMQRQRRFPQRRAVEQLPLPCGGRSPCRPVRRRSRCLH